MKYSTRQFLIDIAIPAGIAIASAAGLVWITAARGQSPGGNGCVNSPCIATVLSPAGVGVRLAPFSDTPDPVDLIGIAPGPLPELTTLAPIRIGVGLHLRSGYLEAVPLSPSPAGRIYGEDLTSQVDGSRSLFAVSRPFLPGSEQVRINGLASIRDRHYVVEGSPAAAIRFLGQPPGIAGGVPDTVAVDYDTVP